MSTVINIYSIKINSISSNGSVNIGESSHHGHTANSKSTGGNSSYGDRAPAAATMKNMYVDPDVNDQTQVEIASDDPDDPSDPDHAGSHLTDSDTT